MTDNYSGLVGMTSLRLLHDLKHDEDISVVSMNARKLKERMLCDWYLAVVNKHVICPQVSFNLLHLPIMK